MENMTMTPERSHIAERRASLQRDIDNYTKILIDLKVEMNNFNPAVSLPAELLSEIFCFCAGSTLHPGGVVLRCEIPDFHHPPPDSQEYTWLAITEVCRQWYAVAVETCKLWSTIRMPLDPRFVKLLLERSRDAPLTVYYNELLSNNQHSSMIILSLILREMHRVRDVDFTLDATLCRSYEGVRQLLVQNTPNLRVCVIEDAGGDWDFSLPLPQIADHPLQILSLNRCLLSPAYLSSLTQLRELTLGDVRSSPNAGPIRFSFFLDALSRMPLLATLRIVSGQFVSDCSDQSVVVTMPSLKRLTLEASSSSCCVAFLDHLRTPGSTQLFIGRPMLDSDELECPLLWQSFLSKISGSTTIGTPPSILMMCISFHRGKLLTGYRTAASTDLPSQEPLFSVDIPPDALGGWPSMLEQFPSRNLRALWLDAYALSLDEISKIAEISLSMPTVVEVHCTHFASDALEKLFMPRIGAEACILPWPSVTVMVLKCCRWSQCHISSTLCQAFGCVHSVRDVLRQRQAYGCPKLSRLIMEGCRHNVDIRAVFEDYAIVIDVVN